MLRLVGWRMERERGRGKEGEGGGREHDNTGGKRESVAPHQRGPRHAVSPLKSIFQTTLAFRAINTQYNRESGRLSTGDAASIGSVAVCSLSDTSECLSLNSEERKTCTTEKKCSQTSWSTMNSLAVYFQLHSFHLFIL